MLIVLDVSVVDAKGAAMGNVEVTVVNVTNGRSDPRYTDGNGFTNHAIEGNAGDLCVITTNGVRFVGSTAAPVEGPGYYRLTDQPAQTFTLTAQSFKRPLTSLRGREASTLHFEGNHLVNAEGVVTPLRSQSFFLGLARMSVGEDITPALRYARDVAGSNMLRTFIMMQYVAEGAGLPVLTPQRGLDQLEAFLTLAAAEQMYVEVTAGDAQVLLPQLDAQQEFFAEVGRVMARHPNAALLTLNEPWKNGLDPFHSLSGVSGVMCGRGASQVESAPFMPPLDVVDQHTERSLADEGYKWVRHQWEMHNFDRAYHEEPMGCAEVQQDGRRDNNPAAFAQAAVVGEVSGVGWCFHPEYGIAAQVPSDGSQQARCAEAVGTARRWVSEESQAWHPTRAGLAESALLLDDAHALRVYMRLGAEKGQAVAVRPQGYVAVGQNGWRVTAQSSDGAFIDMARG